MIRPAIPEDASRIAEILVFSKRTNYRSIFHNDAYSFGELQVLPLALELQRDTALLSEYWVYDDEFVKGLVRISGEEIVQCYVDVFFVGQGIGGALLDFACEQRGAWFLWVLEKIRARSGFTGGMVLHLPANAARNRKRRNSC
ncbi:MAG: GNAT family N-acetyltransferase [Lachnospiraceae bacterium]